MSDYGNYKRWLKKVGLALVDDDEPEMQEKQHAAEIPFDTDDDTDPTLTLHCARCRLSYEACECVRGPVRWPEAGELPFEALNPKDANQ